MKSLNSKKKYNSSMITRFSGGDANNVTRKILESRGLHNSTIKLINAFANKGRFSVPHPSPRRRLNHSRTNKLRNLLNGNRNNINGTRKRKVLELTCPNSNLCLTFNEYYQSMLKDYFKYFLGFDYLDEAIVLSKGSVNGMTTLLKYDRNGYKLSLIHI